MLSDYILRMAEGGHRTAFIEQGVYRSRFYTYAQVAERSLAVCAWLKQNQISTAVLWAKPSARWAISFYGCLLAGVPVAPVDAGFSAEFVGRIAAQMGSPLLVDENRLAEMDNLPAANPQSAIRNPKSEDLAEIVYTSGTTAEPRGVMITHGNLLANLEPVEREIRRYRLLAIPFRPLRFLHLIPLSHLFGQVMGLFIPQFLEGVAIFPESQSPAEWAGIMRERRVSVMISVPRQLEALAQWAEASVGCQVPDVVGSVPYRWWKNRKVHRALGWKMWAFVCGGAALPAAAENYWRALGFAVIQGYGLTETAPAITITHPFKMRTGSVGKVLPGVEVRLDEDGEILVRGPNVSPGYFGDQTHTGEWLRTGDLGRFDESGNLIYLGRKKDVIVTPDGLKVHPDDVERVLLAQPGVREAAVVADERPGHAVVHAVLTGDAEQFEAAVAAANRRLEPHQRIRGFSVWPQATLPRTISTQKLQRGQIQKQVLGVGGWGLGEQGWQSYFGRLGISAEILRSNARLNEDLGLSSLDRVELMTWLETQGKPIDQQSFSQASTVGELAKLLESPAPNPQPLTPQPPAGPLAKPVAALREVLQWLLIFPLQAFYVNLTVEGREKLKHLSPPVLFVSNHQSIMDATVILRGLPRQFRRSLAPAMGPEQFAGRRWRLFLTRLFFNSYLLTPDAGGAQAALRHGGKLAEHGYSTLIFPEGERTRDGRVHAFRPGTGVLVDRLQLPVVPLFLKGVYELWSVHQYSPRRGRVSLRIGDPVYLRAGETAAQFTARLRALYED